MSSPATQTDNTAKVATLTATKSVFALDTMTEVELQKRICPTFQTHHNGRGD